MNTADSPIVTVITPSFNQVRFLERAIVSVLDQGYDRLEYLVADGGSCDGSVDVLRRYEGELAGWWSDGDSGPGDAVNRAMERATGQIVAVLDADDVMSPFTLARVVERFAEVDRPGWVVGNVHHVDAGDRLLAAPMRDTITGLGEYMLSGPSSTEGAGCFYRRDVLDAYAPVDASLMHGWRYDLHCRMLADGFVPGEVDAVVGHRRVHATSMGARDMEGRRREHGRVTWRYRTTHAVAAMQIPVSTPIRTDAA